MTNSSPHNGFRDAMSALLRHLPLPISAVVFADRASRAPRSEEEDPAALARAQRESVLPLRSVSEKRSPLAHGTEKVVARFEDEYLTFSLIGPKAVADTDLLGEVRTSTSDRYQLRFREQVPVQSHLIAESLPFLSN
jgi:hypothetical protein